MKNRAKEEKSISGLRAKIKWHTALNRKKYFNEFFLPKFGLSTKNKESKKLGA